MPRKFHECDWVRLLVPVTVYTEDGEEHDLPPGTEGVVLIAAEDAHFGHQIVEFPVGGVLDEHGEFEEWPDYAEIDLRDDQLELVDSPPPRPEDQTSPPSSDA